MTTSPHVQVLNDFSGVRVEERTRKSGKTHVTMTITSEPIVVNLDPIALGRGPAEAIAKVARDQIRGIGDTASTSTLLARKYAANAFSAGAAWAVRRYSGGRTGATPPAQSDKAYNDSGRLAGGIVAMANPKESSWTINAPANRLDPSTFKGGPQGAAFQSMVRGLVERVPVLREPLQDPEVLDAVVDAARAVHTKIEGRMVEAGAKGRAQVLRLMGQLGRVAERVLTS